jgi:probable F420-dependent oxidoreductase
MPGPKPFRFATGAGRGDDPARFRAAARRAEDLGYSTFAMPDHFMFPFAPLLALQAAADATTTLRVTQLVLAAGFRHPVVLAKELATVDVLSGGRLEVGIGAGWMRDEFDRAGIAFGKASERIAHLEEYAIVLKGLFSDGPFSLSGKYFTVTELDGSPKPVQQPRPPLMIGGSGPNLLTVAAREADIVQVLPSSSHRESGNRHPITQAAFQEKIALIREAAGARFDDIELSTLMINVTITDDADRVLDHLMMGFESGPNTGRPAITRGELLASPVVAVGTVEQVCDKLLEVRDALGFSYLVSPVGARPESLAPVIDRLSNIS